MNADEYEAAFHGIDLPDKAGLFPGTMVSNLPDFISASLVIIRSAPNLRQIDMAKYRLDRLLEILTNT